MLRVKRHYKGFNLVETVVASVILSGAVLTIGTVSTRSLTGTRLNRQYEVAAALIDKQLSLIDYIGIDQFIEAGQTEGDFAEFEPGYHWQVFVSQETIENLYLVTITVTWVERSRPYNLTVDTMFNSVGMMIQTGQE
jgi:Tfp pilus assembly protein PilV